MRALDKLGPHGRTNKQRFALLELLTEPKISVSFHKILFSKILNMMERIKSMDLPTEAFIIMINIVGFASDGVTLDNQQFVEETQSHYMNLLYRSVCH